MKIGILKKTILMLLLLSISSCGVFVKKPIHTPRQNVNGNLLKTRFVYSDEKENYIDQRIHKSSQNIVVMLHGLGAHAGSFDHIQDYLYTNGVSSLALDLRGFGHWKEKRGDLKNIGVQLNDIHEVILGLKQEHPRAKIVLLGESLGSSLSLWYASLYPDAIDGLIITSLVTTSSGNKVKAGTVFRTLFSYTFNPAHPVRLSFDPSLYTTNTDWYTTDTLSTRKISPRYLLQANRVIKNSRTQLCDIAMPIFVLQGGADVLSTKESMTKILANCTSSNIQYAYYPKIKHSIVNDLHRKEAFEAIKQWLHKSL